MANGTTSPSPRPPEERDLIALCRELNAQGAKYLVVGGMAVIDRVFLQRLLAERKQRPG
jgi:hypothetical protein